MYEIAPASQSCRFKAELLAVSAARIDITTICPPFAAGAQADG